MHHKTQAGSEQYHSKEHTYLVGIKQRTLQKTLAGLDEGVLQEFCGGTDDSIHIWFVLWSNTSCVCISKDYELSTLALRGGGGVPPYHSWFWRHRWLSPGCYSWPRLLPMSPGCLEDLGTLEVLEVLVGLSCTFWHRPLRPDTVKHTVTHYCIRHVSSEGPPWVALSACT